MLGCDSFSVWRRMCPRKMRRTMGLKPYRWLLYLSVVGSLVTWTYIFHPSRLHEDTKSPAIRELSVVPNQLAAPQSIALHNSLKKQDGEVTQESNHNVGVLDGPLTRIPTGQKSSNIKNKKEQANTNEATIDRLARDGRYKQVIIKQAEDIKIPDDVSNYGSKMMDDADMADTALVLQQRAQRVREVCFQYGLGLHRRPGRQQVLRYPPTANYDPLYIDRPDALTWCPVYKAASTSWLHNLCLLAGVKESFLQNTKEQISTIARGVWPQLEYNEAVLAVPHTTKFMIVRHPFERLVSAYRDKLENLNIGQEHGVQHFYEKYGRKIVHKYRPKPSNISLIQPYLYTDTKIPAPRGVEPTFLEFVHYLIDTDLVHYSDDHWMPYYLYCTPCYINYDVIAKFETLDRDQRYLLQKLHLDRKISPKWKHLTKGKKTSDIVKKYMMTLSKNDVQQLAEKFKVDFEMFGYSVSDYF